MTCNHTEGHLPDGRRIAGHDCDYVERRVALIPRAEAVADAVAGPAPDTRRDPTAHQPWCQTWNRAFHAEMTRLSTEAEVKHDQMATDAQTEVVGIVRRWRRKGLAPEQVVQALRAAREAV